MITVPIIVGMCALLAAKETLHSERLDHTALLPQKRPKKQTNLHLLLMAGGAYNVLAPVGQTW